MDNVTHSLAGLLLAESAVQLRGRGEGDLPSPRFRAVAAVSSMIAANLPDADLLSTGVGGDHLSYMLQHRGYTHTVVMALAGALLVWAVSILALRGQGPAVDQSRDRRWLLGLLLASTLSHVLLDWTNSYGVHAFWPFDNRWQYGDAVFIVEPWLWIVAVPALVLATTSRIGRALLSLVMVLGLVAAWRVSLVSVGAAAALTVGAVLSIVAARLLGRRARATLAMTAWIVVTAVMAVGAAEVRASALSSATAADPTARVLDVVVSPMPANAVCMSVITVEQTSTEYRVLTARGSALPALVDASRCGSRNGLGPDSHAPSRASTRATQWDREWSAPAGELASLAHESCLALAALRFIRAPIWRRTGDSATVLGDARFGAASGGGFTDVTVRRAGDRCAFAVPPWVPPRAGVIGWPFGGSE
jgi:inner membrane protein